MNAALLTVFFLLFGSSSLFSQSIARSVIGNGGGASASALKTSSNIGEVIAISLESDDVHFAQGFIQPPAELITSVRLSYGRSIQLYPNPAQSFSYLDIKGFKGGVTIQITDIKGAVYLFENLAYPANTYPLDLSAMGAGIYCVTIIDNSDQSGSTTIKLVKFD